VNKDAPIKDHSDELNKILMNLKNISKSSLREFLIWELHTGSLAGYFENEKTIEAGEYRFYWLSLKRNVTKHVDRCHLLTKLNNKSKILVCTLHFPSQIVLEKM